MKVLVYGAGRFGRSIAEVFCQYRSVFTNIVLVDRVPAALQDAPAGARVTTSLNGEAPDIVVVAASAVPQSVRERLISVAAPIEEVMKIERRYDLPMMREIFPWLQSGNWKMLVIATNPVGEWVNAFHLVLEGRLVIGLGTAFDSMRIRCLAAALAPGAELKILHTLRIVGGHGTAIAINGSLMREETFMVAKWMSNALSVAFIKAPDAYAKIWWTDVAIRPFVRGLAGFETATHLIVPVKYAGISAASGMDVRIKSLIIRKKPLGRLSKAKDQEFIAYLQKMHKVGTVLASSLKKGQARYVSEPTHTAFLTR